MSVLSKSRDPSHPDNQHAQKINRAEQPVRTASQDSIPETAAVLIKLVSDGYRSDLVESALGILADHFSCDIVEINLLDESVGHFTPVRWASSKGRSFINNHAVDRYQLGDGYTGWIAEHRSPLLITDTRSQPDPMPKGGLDHFPFNSFLGTPLLWDQELLGTLEIAHCNAHFFSEADCEALVLIASQFAMALQLQRLQDKDDQHSIQQKISNNIHQLASNIPDLDRLWEGLGRAFIEHLELSLFGIFIQRDGTSELSTPYLFRNKREGWGYTQANLSIPVDSDLAAIWLHQEYWLSNQVNRELLSELSLAPIVKRQAINRILLIPLMAGNDRLGLIVVGRSKKLPAFSEEESRTLISLGRQAGLMLHSSLLLDSGSAARSAQNARDHEMDLREAEAAISPERMAELLRLSTELTANRDIDQSLSQVLKLCNELMLADRSALITRDISSSALRLRQVVPEYDALTNQHSDALLSTSEAISEWVISKRHALLLDDLKQDGRWQIEPYNSLYAVPCISGDEITGVLLFFAIRKGMFGSDEQQIGQVVARQMASALNNTYLYSIIREQAERLGLMLRSHQIESSQSNAILESIADGAIVTDADHRVILFNTAAEQILNLSSTQILGREVFEFIGIFGSETIQWGDTIRQWRLTPSDEYPRPPQPERMILEDGRVISILPAPVVLGGDFLGTVSIFRDITRDVEVDRLKSEFVATVSHELRTPMTSIKGFVDLMLMGASGDLNDEQRHFLEIVRTNTNRLEILVNDLLDISRIEAGRASLVFQELDVYQLLAELEQYIQHRSLDDSKAMQFISEAPRELPSIWGDLERVRQILANIVENSFDYTQEGGSIQVSARHVDGQVEIEITDNGMGISFEDQERIFERFYRGEQALIMGVSGTGLGLAIVLNLVEMHRGRIWVTSEGTPGKGTTFTVALPTTPPQEE